MTYLLTIDPGYATGIALGWYSSIEGYVLHDKWLVPGGAAGFADWWKINGYFMRNFDKVIEGFINHDGPADLVSVEVIGWIKGERISVDEYQPPSDKHQCPDRVLKDHHLWVTGSDVVWTDGRDVNDAIIHAIAYLKKKRHLPTLAKYFPDSDE